MAPIIYLGQYLQSWPSKVNRLYRYLTIDSKKPEIWDPSYDEWIAENLLVMSWLLHSMQPNISWGYMLLSAAYEIRLGASQTYLQISNDPQVN